MNIDKLPFFCGVGDIDNNSLPKTLPFSLGVNESNGLIIQLPNKEVEKALNDAYSKEGLFLTIPIDESLITKWRGDEFIDVIENKVDLDVNGKTVLDIGCSTGYILHNLKNKGGLVKGLEPGPSAQTARERYGLDVDRSFFNPSLFNQQFDVVIHLTLLEHIQDPVSFLKQTKSILKKGGLTILGVPDCEEQIHVGDIGMVLHEHWSYFTQESLSNVLKQAGFSTLGFFRSKKGVLYAWGYNNDVEEPIENVDSVSKLRKYNEKIEKVLDNMQKWMDSSKNKSIGLYGASLGASYLLSLLDWSNVKVNIYDGDTNKKGKYLPGCSFPIQSSTDLLKDNPESILIIPVNFSEEILRYLKCDLSINKEIEIKTLSDFN
ncbi:methyltransferase domain-containing protein [Nanoarchaeota archaeon]